MEQKGRGLLPTFHPVRYQEEGVPVGLAQRPHQSLCQTPGRRQNNRNQPLVAASNLRVLPNPVS